MHIDSHQHAWRHSAAEYRWIGPGMERLMFGSDWPVCLVAAECAEVAGIGREFFSQATAGERAQIFGATAVRFSGLSQE